MSRRVSWTHPAAVYLWTRLPKRLGVAPARCSFYTGKSTFDLFTARWSFVYFISLRLRFMSCQWGRLLRARGIITHKGKRMLHKYSTWVKWMMPEISSKSLSLVPDFFDPKKSLRKWFWIIKKPSHLAYVHHNCLFIANRLWVKNINFCWDRFLLLLLKANKAEA